MALRVDDETKALAKELAEALHMRGMSELVRFLIHERQALILAQGHKKTSKRKGQTR